MRIQWTHSLFVSMQNRWWFSSTSEHFATFCTKSAMMKWSRRSHKPISINTFHLCVTTSKWRWCWFWFHAHPNLSINVNNLPRTVILWIFMGEIGRLLNFNESVTKNALFILQMEYNRIFNEFIDLIKLLWFFGVTQTQINTAIYFHNKNEERNFPFAERNCEFGLFDSTSLH